MYDSQFKIYQYFRKKPFENSGKLKIGRRQKDKLIKDKNEITTDFLIKEQ